MRISLKSQKQKNGAQQCAPFFCFWPQVALRCQTREKIFEILFEMLFQWVYS